MRLTHTRNAEEGDILAGVNPLQAGQFTDSPGVDRRLRRQIEIFQLLDRRQMRRLQQLLEAIAFTLLHFLAEGVLDSLTGRHFGLRNILENFGHVVAQIGQTQTIGQRAEPLIRFTAHHSCSLGSAQPMLSS